MLIDQAIYDDLAKKHGMNPYQVRAICSHPFKFARERMRDPSDTKDIRFARFGTFKIKTLFKDNKRLTYSEARRLKGKNMKVNIKRLHQDAVIPAYSKQGDAGLDLTAVSRRMIDKSGAEVPYAPGERSYFVEYSAGLAIEIPDGYVGLLFPRSSIYQKDLALSNCVGVIDSGYRGDLMCKFKFTNESEKIYEIGERFAQLIILPYPKIEFEEVAELSQSERGASGYGSTNKPQEIDIAA